MKKLINEIVAFWNHQFQDFPCVSKAIFISCLPGTKTNLFRLLISSEATQIRVQPYYLDKSQHKNLLDESNYIIEQSSLDGSIEIRVDDQDPPLMDGIVLECINKPLDPVAVVCLQASDKDRKSWTVCYNSLDRQKLLISALSNKILRTKTESSVDLLRFVSAMIYGQTDLASAIYEQGKHLKFYRDQLQGIVQRFDRQINSHGIKRTFQYWSSDQKHAYLDSTRLMIAVLTAGFKNTCIGFGAVLGLHRDNELIAHDDDIDVLIALDQSTRLNLPDALDLVEAHLTRHGYKVEGVFFSHLWVRTPEGHRVDVFIGLIEDNGKLSFYPSARRTLTYDSVFPAKVTAFCGIDLPFPNDPLEYLDRTYGHDWKQPDSQFKHPWDRSAYLDLDGPRRKPALLIRGELANRHQPLAKSL